MSCEQLREQLAIIRTGKPENTKDFRRASALIEELESTCPEGESVKTHTAAILKLGGSPKTWTDENPPIVRRQILLNVDIFLRIQEQSPQQG